MATFLSSEWLRDLSERLVHSRTPARFVIDVIVRGDVEIGYRVDIGPDGTEVLDTDDDSVGADLVLFLDEEGARRLAGGETNAQELLAAGRLKVRGDLRRILDHADALGAL